MRLLGRVAAALCLAVLAACGPQRPPPVGAFEGRLSDWTRQILQDSPELASQAGVTEAEAGGRYANRLDDRSTLAGETRRAAAIRRYAELRAINHTTLSAEDQFTYAVLDAQFERAADGAVFPYGNFTPLGGVSPYVLNQMDSAFLTLPSFLAERQPVQTPQDAEDYLARLGEVAAALDQETQRARDDAALGVRPPQFIMDETVSLLESTLSLSPQAQPYFTDFSAKLTALAQAERDPARRQEIEQRNLRYLARAEQIIRDSIIPAHQRAALFLRGDRQNAVDVAGVSHLPQGQDYYLAALHIETTTSLTPDQIHEIGLARVTELSRELDVALRRVGLTQGTVGQRLSQMTADPRYQYPATDEGRAELMRDVQTRISAVLQRAPQWFGRLPTARLEVRRVPVLAEASQPGAYYSPPSLDGRQPGIYYINLRDLAEMTRIDLPTQDFHEAVPGHHFQIALAQEQTGMPLLRRLMSFNAYSEGWALYAEQLADENGFYDGDPVGRIGYLRWQLWRAARLVVDTGLHAKNWDRQQAIDYLVATTGDAPGVIATEVDRYVTWPGQACGYELGRREIARLREMARNELGPDFDLRGFHDTVLLHGEVPLESLDGLVQDWIPQQRRLAERERRRP